MIIPTKPMNLWKRSTVFLSTALPSSAMPLTNTDALEVLQNIEGNKKHTCGLSQSLAEVELVEFVSTFYQ